MNQTNAPEISVKIHHRGVVRGDAVTDDAATEALCGLCGGTQAVVASIGELDACPDCLRARLEAMSVARYLLKAEGAGLPWGKISG